MLLKAREESNELLICRSLNKRMNLTEKERRHYLNLEKGYEGEIQFDKLSENLHEERYIINDLLLEVNNSYFQIDTLIISQGAIHLLDIKNFKGDYYLELDKLYAVTTGREYKNPVDQLKRSAALFRQLLQNLKQNYLVETSVIFVNPEFTLYQAPMDQPFIFPTQVNRFLRDLDKTPSRLNDGHRKLAQKLISLHQTVHPFMKLPKYDYDFLQKGIYCRCCHSLMIYRKNYHFECEKCGEHEEIESAILRNVEEFKLLFPDRKVTTQSIYEWCKVGLNKKTINRILRKHYTTFGKTSDTFYE
ncbi:nuclease-related domain-containing protein [Cytobacillus massiliigabonensis]|uniref:nuclease-related domain-containing protein n=1 Tax=Cytobacillus massiliigabonensis TaxID=1871011 RepID=UPI000C8524CD|nr:nuclease-related domain-containing protein [Cytobacillus massiliigabonensis]